MVTLRFGNDLIKQGGKGTSFACGKSANRTSQQKQLLE